MIGPGTCSRPTAEPRSRCHRPTAVSTFLRILGLALALTVLAACDAIAPVASLLPGAGPLMICHDPRRPLRRRAVR